MESRKASSSEDSAAKTSSFVSTKPSMTAVAVLHGFYRGLKAHPGYFSEEDEKLTEFLLNYSIEKLNNKGYTLFSYMPNVAQHSIVQSSGGLGFDAHVLSRKMLVRDKIEIAIKSGTKEIVSLAGGFDPRLYLAAKAHQEDDVAFYELDRGQTRLNKIAALRHYDRMNSKTGSVSSITKTVEFFNNNLRYIDCDFINDDLLAKLKENNFDPEKKKLFIAEGLTSYLDEAVNKKLLMGLQKLLQEGDEVLITFVPSLKHTEQGEKALKESGEPYLFALSPENVIEFVSQFGFTVSEKALHAELLDIIGEKIAADAHRKHPEIPKANFYLLTRSAKGQEELNEIKIQDVPNATLSLTKFYTTDNQKKCSVS